MKLKEALKQGKRHEKIVLNRLKKAYPSAYMVEGYFKEYDIFIPEINKSVEVKSDEKSKYTGNIVIEISFGGKQSALSTTKADFWIIYDGFDYNVFETNRIRKCVIENNLKVVTFIGNGDVKSKEAFLVPKKILYKYKYEFA